MNMRVAPTETTETATRSAAGYRRSYAWKVFAAALLAVALAATVWWLSRGPIITVARVTRGAAAEIVYATGSVEPETW